MSTIFASGGRLHKWMGEALTLEAMGAQQDEAIAQTVARERGRLRNFVRKWVDDEGDVEDILQEVFYELVQAYRLMKPLQNAGGWLFRVARNRIIDRFRRRRTEPSSRRRESEEAGKELFLEDVLAAPEAGPEAAYVRNMLFDEIDAALEELPQEQREVFVAHELEGYSFKEISARTGVNVNTLLSRKRYAVLHLRERLRAMYQEFTGE